MEQYKILDSVWFSPGTEVIGIVAVETFTDGQWKAYIGTTFGFDQKSDGQAIAARGAGLRWDMAQGIFPSLDIRKYKDIPEEVAAELTKKYDVHLIRFFKQCELDQSLASEVCTLDQFPQMIKKFLDDPHWSREHTNIQIWEHEK